MKTIGNINLSVDCHCPNCGQYIDIYEYLSGMCVDIYSTSETDEIEEVICPECGSEFEVKLIN